MMITMPATIMKRTDFLVPRCLSSCQRRRRRRWRRRRRTAITDTSSFAMMILAVAAIATSSMLSIVDMHIFVQGFITAKHSHRRNNYVLYHRQKKKRCISMFPLSSMSSSSSTTTTTNTNTNTIENPSASLLPSPPSPTKDDDDDDNSNPNNLNNINNSKNTLIVERNGPDDKIISICVGGDKKFRTLKSTLQISPTLFDLIERAEQQQEQQENNNNKNNDDETTIFIDRDPKHFTTILAYLRNKAEEITYDDHHNHNNDDGANKRNNKNNASRFEDKFKNYYKKHVRLPSSSSDSSSGLVVGELLEDLHIECKYYKLPELCHHLEDSHFIISVINFVRDSSGIPRGSNPFDELKQIYKTIRNISLVGAVASAGTTTMQGITIATATATTTTAGAENDNNIILSQIKHYIDVVSIFNNG